MNSDGIIPQSAGNKSTCCSKKECHKTHAQKPVVNFNLLENDGGILSANTSDTVTSKKCCSSSAESSGTSNDKHSYVNDIKAAVSSNDVGDNKSEIGHENASIVDLHNPAKSSCCSSGTCDTESKVMVQDSVSIEPKSTCCSARPCTGKAIHTDEDKDDTERQHHHKCDHSHSTSTHTHSHSITTDHEAGKCSSGHEHKHEHKHNHQHVHDHKLGNGYCSRSKMSSDHDHHSSCSTNTHHGHESCNPNHDHGHSHDHHHSHSHQQSQNHKHCSMQENDDANSTKTCVALLHENGTDVVVFDVVGSVKVFNVKTLDESKKLIKDSSVVRTDQLCFNSHGSDDLIDLNPCFDEHGLHVVQQDSCVCGIDTPHLHAHLKDPNTCMGNRVTPIPLDVLVSQTLFPVTSEALCSKQNSNSAVESTNKRSVSSSLAIPVTKSMPSDCNSKIVADAFSEKHKNLDCGEVCKDSCPIQKNVKESVRLSYSVQHGDHFDYLVHNRNTGQLHLEHACNHCGLNDVHGVFVALGERLISGRSKKYVKMQFFGIEETKPFNIVEFLQGCVNLNSDRVHAVEHIVEGASPGRNFLRKNSSFGAASKASSTKTAVVRSTILCTGICCSSEIPIIMKILQSVDGVRNVKVNAPLKRVSVDHDTGVISAVEIAEVLTRQNMKSSVEKDGDTLSFLQPVQISTSIDIREVDGRSQFNVQNICCASEIPAILTIVKPLTGVSAVTVNTTTKVVYVDHNVDVISAETISVALTNGGFGSEIRFDAATTKKDKQSLESDPFLVQSVLSFVFAENGMDMLTELQEACSMLQHLVNQGRLFSFDLDKSKKTFTIVHNPFVTTAQFVADYLKDTTFAFHVVDVIIDGSDPTYWRFPIDPITENGKDDGTQRNNESGNTAVYPRPAVILSGVFWIVSMISLAGPKV